MSGVPAWHSKLKADAKALGLKRFASTLQCKHGHVGDWIVASGACAECCRLWSLKKDAANRDKANARVDRYRAKNAEKLKLRARSPQSRAKNNKRQSEWGRNNPTKRKAILERWHKANPERARLQGNNRRHARRARRKGAGGVLSVGLKAKLMRLQRGRCPCCRVQLDGVKQHLDHIISLAAGGSNQDSNIQLLCSHCNATKHTKDPIDFMQSKGYLL